MKSARLLSIAFALCALSEKADATTEIAARTATQILLAADSKANSQGQPGTKLNPFGVCKIGNINRTYWMISGMESWNHDTPNEFDVYDAASQAMSAKGPLQTRVSSFTETTTNALDRILQALIDHFPVWGSNIIEATFAEFDKGPELYTVRFCIGCLRDGKRVRLDTNVSKTEPYSLLGYHEAIDKRIASTRSFAAKLADPKFAAQMIGLEIKAYPQLIGPPVSVVVLNKRGARWVTKGACPR